MRTPFNSTKLFVIPFTQLTWNGTKTYLPCMRSHTKDCFTEQRPSLHLNLFA